MSHLTPDELLDLIEETSLAEPRRAHLESCLVCRGEAAQLASTLRAVQRVDAPEPSPLFWERFADRVRDAVAMEPSAATSWRWVRWPVLVPVAGLALIVLALAAIVAPLSRVEAPARAALVDPLAPTELDPPPTTEATWALVSELVGPIDFETAREAGVPTAPGAADEALLALTADERAELVRLLRAELEQPGG